MMNFSRWFHMKARSDDLISNPKKVKNHLGNVQKLKFPSSLLQIWNCVMSAIEWNKKEDLLQDQALRHLKQYTTLFAAFATSTKSEIVLLNKIQEYCYENMNFLKAFSKIILLLYKSKSRGRFCHFGTFFITQPICIPADVLSEEAVLKWYKEAHSPRGWSVFMDQMKKFVEWLEHAEEGRVFLLQNLREILRVECHVMAKIIFQI